LVYLDIHNYSSFDVDVGHVELGVNLLT